MDDEQFQEAMDERRAMHETLTSIKRAGADIIISYHAVEFARTA